MQRAGASLTAAATLGVGDAGGRAEAGTSASSRNGATSTGACGGRGGDGAGRNAHHAATPRFRTSNRTIRARVNMPPF
jgi:hypothetical protein